MPSKKRPLVAMVVVLASFGLWVLAPPSPAFLTVSPSVTFAQPDVVVPASPQQSVSVTSYGWYVGGSKVTSVSKSSSVEARLSFSGDSGDYRIEIRRDKDLWPDESVTFCYFSHGGGSTTRSCYFTASYGTGEDSTNGDFFKLQKKGWLGWGDEWEMANSYPPRLRVLDTTKPVVQSLSVDPASTKLGVPSLSRTASRTPEVPG
ncbi:MAG: hypothetical protein HYX93_03825 [Chloroflexi bacterium]|nr:hypothetical protein [Chloroflexota bacterium]